MVTNQKKTYHVTVESRLFRRCPLVGHVRPFEMEAAPSSDTSPQEWVSCQTGPDLRLAVDVCGLCVR